MVEGRRMAAEEKVYIGTVISKTEKEKVQGFAKGLNITVSEYLRRCVLDVLDKSAGEQTEYISSV